MTWLVTFRFVAHRQTCKANFRCETCESDSSMLVAIVMDGLAVIAAIIYMGAA